MSYVTNIRGHSRQLEACQCGARLQEGPARESRELQACQPDLSAGQDYVTVHLEFTHQACSGQPDDQAQPAWGCERQVQLDQPDLLL